MTREVVILNVHGSELRFHVQDAEGTFCGTSAAFSSICSLEAALQTLASAALVEWKLSTLPTGSLIKVGRRKVAFEDQLSLRAASKLIRIATTARLDDRRPANRRRHDLTGLRCDLSR